MKTDVNFTFPKKMRLSSKKEIESLFSGAKSFVIGPYRVFYRAFSMKETHSAPCGMAVAVPKKHLKLAVKRNLVKRRIRESFRLHYARLLKPVLAAGRIRLIFLCLYLPYEVKSFDLLEIKMQELLEHFSEILEKGIDLSPDPAG
ncbi:MAG TPA: ribonuclease P protein component [Bacteroidales bacterium]|nr:MAG: ribonuclease P [Bacteroidetes bacterium ADurb.Bin037]HPV87680.1 ribonuclease P protein component [Bacteroidales bacterium]HPW77881.1 ribonuclease P protein component [Bacteroidales bacterium]HQB55339.1 ribonuclease P protein component [Bacteroidales bacterium]